MAKIMARVEALKQFARNGHLTIYASAPLLEALEHNDAGSPIDIGGFERKHFGDAGTRVDESKAKRLDIGCAMPRYLNEASPFPNGEIFPIARCVIQHTARLNGTSRAIDF
ncbi:hypothetical protein GCM10009087_40410 [Sphingomonas oligophenolica]